MNEVTNVGQQVIILLLALLGAGGIGWAAGLKRVWAGLFGKEGWFARLEARFDTLEKAQNEDRDLADVDRRTQKEYNQKLAGKVDHVIAEQKAVRDELNKQQEDYHLVKERIARLEGRRDAQLEAAQLANAVGNVANAITHPREVPPHEEAT